MVNGQKVPSPIRQEIVSIRGVVAGEYTVNIYHFAALTGQPVPATVKVEKLNPTVQVVYYDTLELDHGGYEVTAVRFVLDRAGKVLEVNRNNKSLVQTLRKPRNAGWGGMSLRGEILTLSFGYALLGTLLLLALLRARLPWGVKVAAIVVTSAFYAVVYLRSEGLLGWSAYAKLPPRFQVLWARSVEPNAALNEPGAIHLWVEELDADNLPSGVPRAYRLPYSAKIARKAESARVEIARGHPQRGRAEQFGSGDAPPAPDNAVVATHGEEAGGDASRGGFLDSAFLGGDSQSVGFAPLPVAKLPAKDDPRGD